MGDVIKIKTSNPLAVALMEIAKTEDVFYFDCLVKFVEILESQKQTFLASAELLAPLEYIQKSSIEDLVSAFKDFADGSAMISEGIKVIADKFRSSKGLEEITKPLYDPPEADSPAPF